MNISAKITSKGQITLPVEMRRELRIDFVVLAELVWVLAKQLKRPKVEIVGALRLVAMTGAFRFGDRHILMQAIDDYAEMSADFADFLIQRENEAAGCIATLTLDRKALRHPGFRHPTE
ncbi:MAG: hypothetical protein IPL47_14185 [Phyllobacteriaceae bacterium]|nr:hypothetical protein [Phyllobacteriaceae bacterium]